MEVRCDIDTVSLGLIITFRKRVLHGPCAAVDGIRMHVRCWNLWRPIHAMHWFVADVVVVVPSSD